MAGQTKVKITVGALQAVGGSEWRRDAMHRVYFNDLAGWYGLEVEYYKTGNVSSARLDGERISNGLAREIIGRLSLGRVYFDVADGMFHGRGVSQDDLTTIVAAITAAVNRTA